MNTSGLTAIIIAGGFSRRMNGFKPLLPLGESNLTNRVIDLFKQLDIQVILVGATAGRIVQSGDIKRNYNPGQSGL
jgi:molybdopterin-guanine dinucleotide biosynthesis protein A